MQINSRQRTLAASATCTGVGVHSGKPVRLTVKPAKVNHGIKFVRTDLPDMPGIYAHFNRVVDTSLATVIGADGLIISTIEHLMAGFAALNIDNAVVELDAYELPIMDGSAGPFAAMIRAAGVMEQEYPRQFFVIQSPIELEEDGRFAGVYPATSYRITCTIEYDHPLIRTQSCSLEITEKVFQEEICPARTFGFVQEVEYLRRYGLARGGSLENVVVIDKTGILNEGGLRFTDEFVRHKVLDSIGDFSLLGMPLIGHVVLNKSGHAFNHALLKKIFAHKECWQTCTSQELQHHLLN